MHEAFLKFKTTHVLGYNVFSDTLNVVDPGIDKVLLNTFSPNSYGLALKDEKFEEALKHTDILVLDGMGVAIGSMLIHGKNIKKIAGEDCFNHFIRLGNRRRWKVFFMGFTDATLKKITDRALREYPDIEVASYSPPYKPEFSDEDNGKIVDAINSFNPDVLFIGLTAPKQEKWAFKHKNLVNARIISTIGCF